MALESSRSHLDVSLLERLLKNAGLTQFEPSDVEGMWNEWYRKFYKALEEAVPLRYVTTMSRVRQCPFMKENMLTLIHRRKSVYRRLRASKFKNVEFLHEFRLRTQANNLYRQLRNIYYYSACRQYSRNPKKLWAVISVVTGRKKTMAACPNSSSSFKQPLSNDCP